MSLEGVKATASSVIQSICNQTAGAYAWGVRKVVWLKDAGLGMLNVVQRNISPAITKMQPAMLATRNFAIQHKTSFIVAAVAMVILGYLYSSCSTEETH